MTKRQLDLIARLIARIHKVTSERGKKTELAKYLGTSPQGLNDWLSLRCEPGGEITLLMLEWVSAEEVTQQKTLGDATNITKGRTRKLNSLSHEKSKQVRKRK